MRITDLDNEKDHLHEFHHQQDSFMCNHSFPFMLLSCIHAWALTPTTTTTKWHQTIEGKYFSLINNDKLLIFFIFIFEEQLVVNIFIVYVFISSKCFPTFLSQIFDPSNTRFQAPLAVPSGSEDHHNPQYIVSVEQSPFNIIVKRSSTGATMYVFHLLFNAFIYFSGLEKSIQNVLAYFPLLLIVLANNLKFLCMHFSDSTQQTLHLWFSVINFCKFPHSYPHNIYMDLENIVATFYKM